MTDKAWTSAEALNWTVARFGDASIDNPRLDAELLLAKALGCARVDLYAAPGRPLTPEERAAYRALIERRLEGEPVAYILGTKSFRYLTLAVTPAVLIPRPETELLVEAVLDFAGSSPVTAADVGTGSGAVAVSIAKEIEGSTVYATDISAEALAVARANADAAGVGGRVIFLEGDLLEPLPLETKGSLDVVVSNPPYIPSAEIETLPREIREREPRAALDGGPDGVDVHRRIVAGAPRFLRRDGMLVMEIGEEQAKGIAKMMETHFEAVGTLRDLGGHDRVVHGLRR